MANQSFKQIPADVRVNIGKGWLLLQIGYMFQRSGIDLLRGTNLFKMSLKDLGEKLDRSLAHEQNRMDAETRKHVETTQGIFDTLIRQLHVADQVQVDHVIHCIDDLVHGRILIAEANYHEQLEGQLYQTGEQLPGQVDPPLPPVAAKKKRQSRKKADAD